MIRDLAKWVLLVSAAPSLVAASPSNNASPVDDPLLRSVMNIGNTIHLPAYDLPVSQLLDEKTRISLTEARGTSLKLLPEFGAACNPKADPKLREPGRLEYCQRQFGYKSDEYKRLLRQYPVTITSAVFGGVPVEVLVPAAGISRANRKRVLINLHGGGFSGGESNMRAESIPIAAVGRIKVVSVNYRSAPKFKFPAASQDVEAVYKALLHHYRPNAIGMFGCSAGGLLTAESIAWLQKDRVSLPGAIAMSGSGAAYYFDGDSPHLFFAMMGSTTVPTASDNPYFGPAAVNDPLAFPILSDKFLSRFPPSLLISATRDQGLSSIVKTHEKLSKLGRPSDLHVWEGLNHCFIAGWPLPEKDDAVRLMYSFFDRRLAH